MRMGILVDVHGQPLLATDGKTLLDTGAPTGSAADIADRLRGLLPNGWFPAAPLGAEVEQAPVLAAVLSGFGSALAGFWQLIAEVAGQMRLSIMTGAFLDMAAADYFGASGLLRDVGEGDVTYRARIAGSLIAVRNTRTAVSAAISSLTGVKPVIIEPQNASDCHAYGGLASAGAGGGYGYGTAGLRYGHQGSAQFFVETATGAASGVSAIAAVVSQTKAAGVAGWIRIVD
ncbi:hypothetical protein [Tanticharoenia sakaeratensis]|uniref:Uncharacterized protein n=1 Tax=Tanticharoenia sakaeratensis NBRC 103193 TaxID=1231623 RepID=A0A0D6MQL6_9PROT|nr:hypothetical protein [Tanticharoenia sakaeratensis]GAN55568.1 hypothetical protein Tasa_048_193 [Tanticharoenia sakaeratensis NBRC 103193]GBQ21716.1 hypothetical protein AA103193_1820 [Tanticharoenia sakaeratensis NBRC 103193]